MSRRFVLTGLCAELVVVGGTSLAARVEPATRGLDVAAYVLLALAALAVPWALAQPVPSFVLALGTTLAFYELGYVRASPIFLTLLAVLFLAATPRSIARSVIMGLATFAAVLGSSLYRAGPAGLSASTFSAAAWIAAFILAGHAITAQRAYIASMRERARRAEETKELEVRRSVAEEWLRIARELHDVVSHTISVINVQAAVAAHVLDQRPEQARPAGVIVYRHFG